MEKFIIKTNKGVAYITNETAGLIVKAEKDRVLTGRDCGAVMEATLYREVSGFVPVCNYVFEAVDARHNPVKEINSELFQSAVKYFFTVYLNTAYYVKKIPRFSTLYTGVIFSDNTAEVCNSL
ncbi:MAG TPA: hypothetical protein VIM16_09930 [Mucilaginibacter sp.]|jgi:hypothetical protein